MRAGCICSSTPVLLLRHVSEPHGSRGLSFLQFLPGGEGERWEMGRKGEGDRGRKGRDGVMEKKGKEIGRGRRVGGRERKRKIWR